MINIDTIKKQISVLSEDDQNEFLIFLKPIFDFNDFMFKKHNLTPTEINNEQEKISGEILGEKLSKINNSDNISKLKEMVNILSDVYKLYAEQYNYPNAEEYKKVNKKYLEYTLKNNFNNGK